MKRILLALALLALPGTALAQTSNVRIVGNDSTGQQRPVLVTTDGKLQVDSTAGAGSTTAVEGTGTTGGTVPTKPVLTGGSNGTQIYPIGVDSTSNQFVTIRSGSTAITSGADNVDNTTVNSTANNLRMLGRNTIFNGTTWDRTRTIVGSNNTGLGVTAVAIQPCAVAGCGITPVSTTAASSGVVAKASGGNVYRLAVTTGASAGYIIGLNQTTIPADGATPATVILCRPVAATSALSIGYSDMPSYWPTGIVFVFSTTGCFTITKSATAFIEYHVQ